MGVRSILNDKPILAIAACGLMITVAAGSIVRYMRNAGTKEVIQAFYTTDDGKTWFADGIDKVPPFEHDGQTAVKAHLFQNDQGSPFVAYLERYTDDGKKKAEKLWADARVKATDNGGKVTVDPMILQGLMISSTEVKKPGTPQWYKTAKAPASVLKIQCPDGKSNGDIQPYLP